MKPVISLWGFGPTYRKRIKLNIMEAIKSGYADLMDYVILTDYPDDFKELGILTGKIVGVVNIHEIREQYPWSKELEFIPSSYNDEAKYAEEYRTAMSQGLDFNYSLHRFSFPKIAELGYNKIVFMDADVKIKYDQIGKNFTEQEFWAEFDTRPNTMKGCVKETVQFIHQEDGSVKFQTSMAMGSYQSKIGLQLASVLVREAYKKYGPGELFAPILDTMDITEGPFRYYHFDTTDKVKKYFNVWNDNIKIATENRLYRNCNLCGGYMLCDYIPVAAANIYHSMTVEHFPNKVYQRQIWYEDRYFIPPAAAGFNTRFTEASTQEEFLEKNKELVDKLKLHKAWPHVEHY